MNKDYYVNIIDAPDQPAVFPRDGWWQCAQTTEVKGCYRFFGCRIRHSGYNTARSCAAKHIAISKGL